jgi:hypothetical protein
MFVCALVQHHARDNLFEVILALRAAGCLAGGLNGRQQQCYQNTNDCDDDE